MIFRQLFEPETCVMTYLIGDAVSREALVIDPRSSQLTLIMALLAEHQLTLKYVLRTHIHPPDQIGCAGLCIKTNAQCCIGNANSAEIPGIRLFEGQVLKLGDEEIHVLATPGHTSGCLTYCWRDRIFCGDVMEIGGCGQLNDETNAGVMFDSVKNKIFMLADEMLIFPGHDYTGRTVSTIAEERRKNKAFSGVTRDEFIARNIK